VQRALALLADVFADPAAPGAAAVLADLRARWPQLAAEERAALTPIARLAAGGAPAHSADGGHAGGAARPARPV